MSLIRRRKANVTTRRAGVLRKSVAQLAVLALVSVGAVVALAGTGSATIVQPTCGNIGAESPSVHFVLLCKEGPATAVAGTDIEYTITTHSTTHKYDDHEFLVTDDPLPPGTTLVSVDGGSVWDCSGSVDTVVCTNTGDGSDIEGAVITVTLHIDSASTEESIENCATLSMDLQPEHVSAEGGYGVEPSTGCADTDITRESDISIEKTGPASLVVPNDIVYTITATNNGPSDSDPVTVTDTFPANTTFVTTGGGIADWNCAGSHDTTLTCTTLKGLVSGASASFTLTLHVDASQATHALENCAAVTAGDTSAVSSNDSQCTSIEGANVTLVKAAEAALPITGVAPHFTG